jgi:hypothetical protein
MVFQSPFLLAFGISNFEFPARPYPGKGCGAAVSATRRQHRFVAEAEPEGGWPAICRSMVTVSHGGRRPPGTGCVGQVG